MFGFWKWIGTVDCLLLSDVGSIYQSFCDKEFLSAMFVDIKGAYNSDINQQIV